VSGINVKEGIANVTVSYNPRDIYTTQSIPAVKTRNLVNYLIKQLNHVDLMHRARNSWFHFGCHGQFK